MIPYSLEHNARIARYGSNNMRIDIPTAIKFGTRACLGIPDGIKLDHVKLPKL